VNGLYSFVIESPLRAPADRVWAHASSFAGINRELWPLRMTHPPGHARLTPETTPLGRPAFRSWILLFGLVPVDFDDLMLIELEPGRGFSEVSRLFSAREWRHRRTVTPAAGGCVVRDEVTFVPRWPRAGPVLARVYRLAFELRHRVLRRRFGAGRVTSPT
jgi:ligand-binding SRPBCC domain-containing protein